MTKPENFNDSCSAPTTQQFPHSAESIRAIRAWVRLCLRDLPQATIDSAVLLVSEIATNTVVHCGGHLLVVTLKRSPVVRVEVRDKCPGEVHRRRAAESDAGGRGLSIVDQVAKAWGSEPDRGGKKVWFELADA